MLGMLRMLRVLRMLQGCYKDAIGMLRMPLGMQRML